MLEIPFIQPILVLLLAVLLIYFALKLGKQLVLLLINSFIGLVILVILNFLPFASVEINVWSILITALGGIPGIILLIILSQLGIAF
ncbi:MAG: pro-sigmaK processing inhibitor BofA family protein [archaeon]